jgi:hypothetical protein
MRHIANNAEIVKVTAKKFAPAKREARLRFPDFIYLDHLVDGKA